MAGEIFVEDACEDGVGWRDCGEEGGGGAEFEVVWETEDLVGGFAIDGKQGFAAFDKAGAENRMFQIGAGFLAALDRVEVGDFTFSQADDLGEYIPHPMGLLATSPEFGEGLGVIDLLGGYESLKLAGIRCHGSGSVLKGVA